MKSSPLFVIVLLLCVGCGGGSQTTGSSTQPTPAPTPTPTGPTQSQQVILGEWNGTIAEMNHYTGVGDIAIDILQNKSGTLTGTFTNVAPCEFLQTPISGSIVPINPPTSVTTPPNGPVISTNNFSLVGVSDYAAGGTVQLTGVYTINENGAGSVVSYSMSGTLVVSPASGQEYGCLSQNGGGVDSPLTGHFSVSQP